MTTQTPVTLFKKHKNGKVSTLRLSESETGSLSSQIDSRPALLVRYTKLQTLISKKLREGWTTNGAESDRVPLLMLSQDLRGKVSSPDYMAGAWVCQPKLNGVRCSAFLQDGEVKFYTKKRKEIVGLQMLKNSLKPLLEKHSLVLDGEIYVHRMRLQRISGLVRRSVNIKPEEEKVLELHIFDVVDSDKPFRERYNLIPPTEDLPTGVVKVPCFTVSSQQQCDSLLKEVEGKGFEGLMLRHLDSPYLAGFRSEHLLKYKSFQDAEFEIVGFRPGEGKDSVIPIFTCKTSAGEEFDVKMEGTYKENSALLPIADTLVGKPVTVRFFSYTERGVPEFPIGVAIRDYE